MREWRGAFLNRKRLREILTILYRHGFGAILLRLGLGHWLGFGERFFASENRIGHADTAERLVVALQEMGTTYIKFGQMLANRADLLPAEYLTALTRLQNQVAPLPFATMRSVLERELTGTMIDEVFSEFSTTPLAAGSIGQVYAAVLKSTGERVVVKIKRPEIDQRMREDLSLLRFLAEILAANVPEIAVLSPVVLVEEFARGLLAELDLLNEAAATERFYRQFCRTNGTDADNAVANEIKIPRVFWDLTSREVLVTERLIGEAFNTPNFSPRVDGEKLAGALVNCFWEQYFTSGFFHSDPHPGNLLLLSDGKIGIVDFGQVGQIAKETQHNFIALTAAMIYGDMETAVDLCCALADSSGRGEASAFRRDLAVYIRQFIDVPQRLADPGAVITETIALARRQGLSLPRELVLFAKSLTILHHLIFSLAPNFRLQPLLLPLIKRTVSGYVSPSNVLLSGAAFSYRTLRALKNFPRDLRDLLLKINVGNLRIIFHHEGLENIGDQVERASNRITLGLLIAAILLGSSVILATAPEFINKIALPFIEKIPLSAVIAGAGYLSAMALGFWLAWAILRGKRL